MTLLFGQKKKTGTNLGEMDDKHREILRRQRLNLRRDPEVMKLLPKLFSLLDPGDEEEVKAEATRGSMVEKIFSEHSAQERTEGV